MQYKFIRKLIEISEIIIYSADNIYTRMRSRVKLIIDRLSPILIVILPQIINKKAIIKIGIFKRFAINWFDIIRKHTILFNLLRIIFFIKENHWIVRWKYNYLSNDHIMKYNNIKEAKARLIEKKEWISNLTEIIEAVILFFR
jgi:hypothetical protein